jgi:hypothetical protein
MSMPDAFCIVSLETFNLLLITLIEGSAECLKLIDSTPFMIVFAN